MIDHRDRNTAVAEEFGWFLDGTKVPNKNWDKSEPAAGKHFVYETSAGKWKTADENTNFSCTTCELGAGEYRAVSGKQTFWGAFSACRALGGDLPKKMANVDKSNYS